MILPLISLETPCTSLNPRGSLPAKQNGYSESEFQISRDPRRTARGQSTMNGTVTRTAADTWARTSFKNCDGPSEPWCIVHESWSSLSRDKWIFVMKMGIMIGKEMYPCHIQSYQWNHFYYRYGTIHVVCPIYTCIYTKTRITFWYWNNLKACKLCYQWIWTVCKQ